MNELDLLMEEILMNIFVHGYGKTAPGPVTIAYTIPAQGKLAIEIRDQGVEFNPLTATLPDLTLSVEERRIGGLGILLLRSLAGSLRYCREDGSNRLMFEVSANR